MVSFFVYNFYFYIANLFDCENRRGHLLLFHDEMGRKQPSARVF